VKGWGNALRSLHSNSSVVAATQTCPLCLSDLAHWFYSDRLRDYFQCPDCQLISVPATQFLNPSDEKARYDYHENSPHDPEYRKFLDRLYEPLRHRLIGQKSGLDFGSGPGPTLSVMLEEIGHTVSLYDPFYASDAHALKIQYDFVTASEVLEHVRKPRETLDTLWGCVRPGGLLGIMTKQFQNLNMFGKWAYKNDDTHIHFYSRQTFEWLKDYWRADVQYFEQDVVIFDKK